MSRHPTFDAPASLVEAPGPDPIQALDRWLTRAHEESGMEYASAMTLSTVDADGFPDARIVLLKGLDERGLRFYTNYRSTKGQQLTGAPRASATFYWDALGRQVRVRGGVEWLASDESDEYFESRSRGSQLGAWASDQSSILERREELETRLAEVEERFEGRDIPRPPHWGGFLLVPREVEFWQAGEFRLHDRFVYRRVPQTGDEGEGEWNVARLNP